MAAIVENIHVISFLGLALLLLLWVVLFKCAYLLIMLLRHEPLIGWGIGPLGITMMFLHEPSALFICLSVIVPALVSGGVLYIGLFTSLSPVSLPDHPLIEIFVIVTGVVITSAGGIVTAFQDLRHPLWGEARILRSMQLLRATCSKIHFTSFGYSYLKDHFRSTPHELLQAL